MARKTTVGIIFCIMLKKRLVLTPNIQALSYNQ
jgi:hypothetical protein